MPGRARADILAMAVDLGLHHIDTAPAYGDGLAERAIGEVFRGRRESIVVATKVGFYPNKISDRVPALGGAVRALRMAGRLAHLPRGKRRPITPAGLRSSLEASLRRLQMDFVDAVFLHEPSPDVIPDPEAVLEALLSVRRAGLARHVGVAGDWGGIAALGRAFHSEPILVQTREDQWNDACPPDIAYGILSPGQQSFGNRRSMALSDARDRFLCALARRPGQTVLVSTTEANHLHALATLAADAS
jgi:aryl-alcohol dehydrogenase-like predicted oxidoreductase